MKSWIFIFIFLISFIGCKKTEPALPVDKAKLISVDVSSELADSKNRYNKSHLTDNTNESWCEGNSDVGQGEKIHFIYDKKVSADKLYIKNGYGDRQYYSINGRIKEFKLFVDDIDSGLISISDSPTKEIINFPKPVEGSKFTFEIASIYPAKLKDTCISELSLVNFDILEPPVAKFCGLDFSSFDYQFQYGFSGELKGNGEIDGRGNGGWQCGEFGGGKWESGSDGNKFSIGIDIRGVPGETCAGGGDYYTFTLISCDKKNNKAIFQKSPDKNLHCDYVINNGNISLSCDEN